MDIRKFFSSTSTSGKLSLTKKRNETKVESRCQETKKGTLKKRGARIMIESDSDDEEPLPKISRRKINNTETKKYEGFADSIKSPKTQTASSSRKDLKMVSVDDFFSGVPVRQSNRDIFAEKTSARNSVKLEAHIHEDENFQKTLEEITVSEEKNKKCSATEVVGERRNRSSSQKMSPGKTQTNKILKTREINLKSSSKIVLRDETPKIQNTQNAATVTPVKSSLKDPMKNAKEEIVAGDVSKDVSPEEKKRANALNYKKYLQRDGPAAPGSKEIPQGQEGCLQGLTFVVTGVLDSLDRDEAKELVEKYEGKVTSSLSKKTSFIIVGRDSGVSKLEKAEKFGTQKINEDELLEMIRTRPARSTNAKKTPLKEKPTRMPNKSEKKNVASPQSKVSSSIQPTEAKKNPPQDSGEPLSKKTKLNADITNHTSEMWVDKYKPSSVKQLIGQQGDKSNAKKLSNWLSNWHKNNCAGKKHPPPRWGTLDDGASRKAALLSGTPGVGKTTTAQLVCKELGFDYVEMNASDTRSKKNLQEHVQEMLTNQTLNGFVTGEGKAVSRKHVIIMDEADGMSGNEDRGGTQELIALIKSSRIPVICICNDRSHPKIRSLANYCFDLRFQRPRVEQIKAAMMSISYKEKLTISPATLQEIIVASNQDVRQVLHNMSLWCSKDKGLTAEQAKQDTTNANKDIKLSPFDVLRKVFSAGQETERMTIHDKSDLFFHDYSLAPLFVQENYLDVKPVAARGDIKEHLRLVSATADSICDGDLVDSLIRKSQHWNLLPVQAIYSSVIPGDTMRGYLSQMIQFPSWLGKNSTRNHSDRVLQTLHMHTRLRMSGDKSDLNMDYLQMLRDAIAKPLRESQQDGVSDVLRVLEYYFLLREDIDCIMELSLWSGQDNPLNKINPKVKAALTRAFNKEGIKNPYCVTQPVKRKRGQQNSDEFGEDHVLEEEETEDDDISSDAMIKQKKVTATTAKKPSTSKVAQRGRKKK